MPADDPAMPSGGPVRTTDLGETDLEQLGATLRDALRRLDDAGIGYGVMGGLAVTTLSRPRWTHDIDVFLRPRDAAHALELLAAAGYETERSDHEWLFKARRDQITVDLIFRSSGHIYFDDELEARLVRRSFLDVDMPVVSPEDLLVIKSAADSELNHYHWFDAIGLLTRHDLDWAYVLRRARSTRRHLLSLLVYADAADIEVPPEVIRRLADDIYGETSDDRPPRASGRGRMQQVSEDRSVVEEQLTQRLRTHPDIGDLDVRVSVRDGLAVVSGDVETAERRDQVGRCAAQLLAGWDVDNRVRVREIDGEPHVEVVS